MRTIATTAIAFVLAAGGALAAETHKATGTITKVDRDKAQVTIKHGPVPSMRWPAMTMGFAVKDKVLLDKAKPGSQVEFAFEQSGSDYVITEIK